MIDDTQWKKAPPLQKGFFDRPAEIVAPDLIGCYAFIEVEHHVAGGMIVETEAYDQSDYASHCYEDEHKRARSDSGPMKWAGGHLYLYWNNYWPSINFVCDRNGFGSAVLIRAIEPVRATEAIMIKRREPSGPKNLTEFNLCNGPQNICQALGIADALYNLSQTQPVSLFAAPFDLRKRTKSREIVCGPRIGIAKQFERELIDRRMSPEAQLALSRNWRFGFAGSKFVSKTFVQYASRDSGA
jgi:DNA-3-methyladenine glycosylase